MRIKAAPFEFDFPEDSTSSPTFAEWATAHNKRYDDLCGGKVLWEHVDNIEAVCLDYFKSQKIRMSTDKNMHFHRSRQIDEEWRKKKCQKRFEEDQSKWSSYEKSFEKINGYRPLRHGQLTTALFLAARVMNELQGFTWTYRRVESPNPFELATEAMRLERCAMDFWAHLSFLGMSNTKNARDAKKAKAGVRRSALAEIVKKEPNINGPVALGKLKQSGLTASLTTVQADLRSLRKEKSSSAKSSRY